MSETTLRCAIYTRKSSEEGLDQDFNSLDAQREACEAYIASQRHEGWKQLAEHYDDGGISGGTLERPALQRLLADIDAGRIDLVVVYKVDRLTRSLPDFAKLIERLDAAGASFVSVTQSFNTSTSMGRLTLNVLLSFAQFEREVTAERIQDKLAQSKAKGLWMGGYIPLGYTPNGRTLDIVPDEAQTVRRIFNLYDELGCLRLVEQAAVREGLRTKTREANDPKMRGGKSFSRGRIQNLLRNPLYIGKIRHKDIIHEGQHSGIVDDEVFKRVQEKLDAASRRADKRRAGNPGKIVSLLAGKVFDDQGRRLTPSHTSRGSRRFRYYVSRDLIRKSGNTNVDGLRLPAKTLEDAVAACLSKYLSECQGELSAGQNTSVTEISKRTNTLEALAKSDQETRLATIQKVVIEPGKLTITAELVRSDGDARADEELVTFVAPFTHRRRGVETKLILSDQAPTPDANLQKNLGRALAWLEDIHAGVRMEEIAERENLSSRFIRDRLQMAFLSPKIMDAILKGTQPAHLTSNTFVRADIPLDWSDQEALFGFTN
ncbi:MULTISPECIES: recombinase family protein [Maricaulis]|uniref:Recombinase n=1 Tax=Maricaulis maris (strain MCS10) TaxID=394221 RepID=Q0ATB9_MARMM|nr:MULTISPECIES: recombinase family protein [Maricaulis]ABI64468.1 Recombinase [Maricaulis maris MCS10]MAC89598.1 recombinase family protein [Maricaulis sp.]